MHKNPIALLCGFLLPYQILLLSSFFFFLSSFVWADIYNEVSGQGLFIDTIPGGAEVYIDGVERGLTPFTITTLRQGRYDLRVYKEGYAERRTSVTIVDGTRVEVTLNLQEERGQVLLNIQRAPNAPLSLAFEPRLVVDGSVINIHSDMVSLDQIPINLKEGWRTISIEAFGWERETKSILVKKEEEQQLEFILKPALFALNNARLNRSRFNPYSQGSYKSASISFNVNAPGSGTLEVFNSQGILIYSEALDVFTTFQQQVVWSGKTQDGEIANDGTYTIKLSAWGDGLAQWAAQNASFTVLLNSTLDTRPLSIASAVPGLLFAASPQTLPARSFQAEGSLLAGKPFLGEAWESLPFAAAFRFSITETIEASLAYNAEPKFESKLDWGIGASAKWRFIEEQNKWNAAAQLSFGWATHGIYTGFGMGCGPRLGLPVSFSLIQNKQDPRFDLLLCPFVLWAGGKGYADSFIPRLGIEGGALLSWGTLAAGVSLRWDYGLNSSNDESKKAYAGNGPLATALEFKWNPSNFVLTLFGGYWHWSNNDGAFMGLSLGFIY